MKKKVAEVLLVFLFIFAISFLLNFVWESFHSAFLYEGMDFAAKKYVLMVSYVSAVDGSLIFGIYLLLCFLWRDIFWLRKMNRKHGYSAFIAGLAIAAVIEYRRIYITMSWRYNQLMPTIFGIGLSPLVQLSITGVTTFWLTRRIFKWKE
jgi:hypothetical protein